ncbi:MAG: MFS transporter [Planctomycetota bacterium]
MSNDATAAPPAPSKTLFWGCFLALITTAFGFITRLFLLGEWAEEFGLDPAQTGELAGMGIWPFAISIIGFSLFIDRIGYKTAMVVSFVGYLVWSVMGVSAFFVSQGGDTATGYNLLYWGSLILGLSNGTVEAYINPVVATMFKENKTKWLNILHAGWPGGLVIAGLLTIGLNALAVDWWIRIAIIAPPAVVFFLILIGQKFPEQERVASGVSYREMLAEFGVLGTAIAGLLIVMQLSQTFPNVNALVFWMGGIAAVAAMGVYTQSMGNPLLFVLALIMIPLATTEIGTDSWIEEIMKGVVPTGIDAGLVLVYTSLIMMVLRFFAGPIVHSLSPIGLLIGSSVLAIAGLYWLSFAAGAAIFAAATLYAFGKTFFWPTMLGVAGEQTPKGGALTLNALGGIGMLAVGTLGTTYIGALQAGKEVAAAATLVSSDSEAAPLAKLVTDNGEFTASEEKSIYGVIGYRAISESKIDESLAGVPADQRELFDRELDGVREQSKQGALADMCVFPATMLLAYIGLGLYFKSRGGYAAEVLTDQPAEPAAEPGDGQLAGAVATPAEA